MVARGLKKISNVPWKTTGPYELLLFIVSHTRMSAPFQEVGIVLPKGSLITAVAYPILQVFYPANQIFERKRLKQ